MCAASCRGSVSTLGRVLEVVHGSMTSIRGLRCSAISEATDGIISVVSRDCDEIVFLESCDPLCSDDDVSTDVTLSTGSLESNSFLVRDTPSSESVDEALSGSGRLLLEDDPGKGSDRSSFDPGLSSVRLKSSAHSFKPARRDISSVMPLFTGSHECPGTIFGKSDLAHCVADKTAISGISAITVPTGR